MISKENLRAVFAGCLLAALMAGAATARTIYVNDDAAGANDGSTWADAYKYLQDALADADSAEKPVEIRVARGTYRPDLGGGQTLHDQEATFRLIDGVTLRGGFAGQGEPNPDARDVGLSETILSGDLTGNDVAVEDPRALPAETSRDENSYHVVTGGKTGQTAVLDGFTITAGSRHGMYNKNGSPAIAHCTFRGNRAQRWGGGLCNDNGSPTLNHCTFRSNCAQYGGGLWNLKGSPILTSCTFQTNSATYGGGMYNYENSHPQIANCIFSQNSAAYGAGIYSNKNCRPVLVNCTFVGNLAEGNGGAMRNVSDSSPALTNCILSGNVPDEIVDYVMSGSSVRYCSVRGGTDKPWFGEGCIDGDPLFLGGDDLRLSPDSPCIDAGNNAAVPSEITTDLDDRPRIINGIVDMGAFEAGAI